MQIAANKGVRMITMSPAQTSSPTNTLFGDSAKTVSTRSAKANQLVVKSSIHPGGRSSNRIKPSSKAVRSTLPLLEDTQSPTVAEQHFANAYLSRLGSFTKDLLEDTPFNLISLFCGGGGLDLGLSFAGFGTRVASDLAPAFVDSVVGNLPHAKACKEDALKLTKETLCELAGTRQIDLLAAGPPCQSFSILGRRGALDDPRGKLALKYFDLIAAIRPKAFLFENVPGLLSVNKGEDWRRLMAYAKETTGYFLHPVRLNAAAFGIPQFRERVMIVGLRQDVKFEFPSIPTGPKADELISSLTELNMEGSPSAWALESVIGLPNHDIRIHGSRVRERYLKIAPGDRDRTDHTDRIDPTRPSGTVLVGSGAGGGRPHIHPHEPRVITVREAARLQSFPDWYVFHGTSTAQYRQVGNAVPPLLAYEVGKKIKEALQRFK
jgi:DNA (cytosine-5)-methyltransferase 1